MRHTHESFHHHSQAVFYVLPSKYETLKYDFSRFVGISHSCDHVTTNKLNPHNRQRVELNPLSIVSPGHRYSIRTPLQSIGTAVILARSARFSCSPCLLKKSSVCGWVDEG